jgi:hypothetical protein
MRVVRMKFFASFICRTVIHAGKDRSSIIYVIVIVPGPGIYMYGSI